MLYQDKHVLPVALACYLQNFIQHLSSFSGGNLYVISGPICSSVKDCKAQHLRSYQWKKTGWLWCISTLSSILTCPSKSREHYLILFIPKRVYLEELKEKNRMQHSCLLWFYLHEIFITCIRFVISTHVESIQLNTDVKSIDVSICHLMNGPQ